MRGSLLLLIHNYVSEYCNFILTQTSDSSIFRVGTVVKANTIAGTAHKSGFSACTLHIVQEDAASSLAKEGKTAGNCTCDGIKTWFCGYLKSRVYDLM